ncbi:Integrase catalytic core [Botryosphaeria dothidea]|uniref:Integrase catalytic core n=1 Tax=Botryosphaeria dothidea TaxID=55169 RepID=A0A8H4N540_9PEZI|nr:Integrase catalytic core [Botryosphaeria dothidea]
MQHDSEYASPILRELRLGTKTLDVSDVIVDYREHARQKQALITNKTHATFAATLRGEEQPQKPPKCLCGLLHWYFQCFYLNPNAPNRPADFKPNKKVQDKILKLIKNDKIKTQVENALKRGKEPKPNTLANDDNSDDEQGSIKSFPAVIAQSFATHRDSRPTTLELSWIADTGPDDFVICGNTRVPIKSFGNVIVNARNGKKSKVITLRDIAYVLAFMGNLVSISKCNEKDVHMDTKSLRLYKDDTTVCVLTPSEGQFFLELHQAESVPAITSAATTRSLPAEQWHGVFAHANYHAIKALLTAVTGVEFTNDVVPVHCDTCSRAKAHQLVARDSSPEEARNESFFRVSFDLIQMTPAFNQHEWITHIECIKSNYVFTRTYMLKLDCNTLILDILSIIERRFDALTAFFRTDGERSLNTAFKAELKRRGITIEVSAPYTPAQNGHAERTETVLAATYIHNRTPSKVLKWKTPFELAHGIKPNVAHMRVYGCKAYALNKTIPRRDRIIRSRDVSFDESSKYSPDEQEQYQEIEDIEEEPQEVIPRIRLGSEDLITSDSSSSEDEEVTHEQATDIEEQPTSLSDRQQQGILPDKPDIQHTQLHILSPSTTDNSILYPPSDDVLPSPTLRDSHTSGARGNRAPLAANINADPNPNLIIEGPRNRRRAAHAAKVISNAYSLYRELQEGNGKGVWIVVDEDQARKANKEVIPLTWVFKYKFDKKGYLTKIKARVCVRGDLQVSYQDTYAATLAFRIFRTLMAIVYAFDLEMWQYDVVNAFPHVPLD